jgi:signal peptidase I
MQLTFDGVYLPISAADGIYERTYAAEGEILPAEVRPGYYFVLGDNRGSARDSRMLGQISQAAIKGRIIAVLRRRQI